MTLRKLKKFFERSSEETNTAWVNPIEILQGKWSEIPTTSMGRRKSSELLTLSDKQLLDEWMKAREDVTTGEQFSHRGWIHVLYKGSFRDKEVLDVGSGFALDSITLAQNGAHVTFLDIVEDNLQLVKRLCRLLGLHHVNFFYLKDLESLKLLQGEYDAIFAMGSLHHVPFDVAKGEANQLLHHLRIGGRWIQLAYPKTRWVKEGELPFDKWGEATDGRGTPWAEWYDLPKLLALLEPATFEIVLCQEFHHQDFIWFDLLLKGWVKPIER